MSDLRRLQANVTRAGGEIRAKRVVQAALQTAGYRKTPRSVTRGGFIALLREGSADPVLHKLLTYVGKLPKGFHVPASRGEPALVLAEMAVAVVERNAAGARPQPPRATPVTSHNPRRRYVGDEEVASFGAPSRSQARRTREREPSHVTGRQRRVVEPPTRARPRDALRANPAGPVWDEVGFPDTYPAGTSPEVMWNMVDALVAPSDKGNYTNAMLAAVVRYWLKRVFYKTPYQTAFKVTTTKTGFKVGSTSAHWLSGAPEALAAELGAIPPDSYGAMALNTAHYKVPAARVPYVRALVASTAAANGLTLNAAGVKAKQKPDYWRPPRTQRARSPCSRGTRTWAST